MASSRNSLPPDIGKIVAANVRRHLRAGASLTVGLSGGLDSVVLLHALLPLRDSFSLRLRAFHVHHRLSPNADGWQAFCARLCAGWGIPFESCRVSVERRDGSGLEAAARRARYAAYSGAGPEYLALAHHRDDQGETLLLNLLRGAGVAGAAGMSEYQELRVDGNTLRVIRPLLDVARSEIEGYARAHGLDWIRDESNEDPSYSRNFLRHRILPPLKQRFPGCDAALARAAAHFAEAEGLLDDLALADAGGQLPQDGLDLELLLSLSDARRRNLVRFFLKRTGVQSPSAARLSEWIRQVMTAGAQSSPELRLPGCRLLRYRGAIRIARSTAQGEPARWSGEPWLAWGNTRVVFLRTVGEGLSAARLGSQEVTLETRRPGARLQPDCKRPRRSLKNLFQEGGVPSPLRASMPFLYCGSDLIWAPGIGVDCAYQCRAGEPGWRVEWECA